MQYTNQLTNTSRIGCLGKQLAYAATSNHKALRGACIATYELLVVRPSGRKRRALTSPTQIYAGSLIGT